MPDRIVLITQGVRGGKENAEGVKGRVMTLISRKGESGDDSIIVDNYEGFGRTYKEREEAVIEIRIANFTWKGTRAELQALLMYGHSLKYPHITKGE